MRFISYICVILVLSACSGGGGNSNNGEYPILCDTSPCTKKMHESFISGIKVYEPIEFCLDNVVDELEFTKNLYKEKNIKVLPGSFLGREGIGKGYVRIALVENADKTREVLNRLKDFMND